MCLNHRANDWFPVTGMTILSTLSGTPVIPLGLAAHPDQDPQCVSHALEAGINYFFFYDLSHKPFAEALRPLLQSRRDEMFVASGSGSRRPAGLRTARRKIAATLGVDALDIFFAEYIHPDDDLDAIFGNGGVLDELQQWKADGSIRFVGATAHDRKLAHRLAQDAGVDVLMHRFNMAHRKAAREVFPAAVEAQTPVVAFTATRWGTLLEPHAEWSDPPPSAADCYRYCLAQPAVRIVLTAPHSIDELKQNLAVLQSPAMEDQERARWERYGDVVYARKRDADPFESRWP
jgi:aryl-alcohol dehydrogenase-like predicted oxidoreductase